MKSHCPDSESFPNPEKIWDQAARWLGEVDGGLTPDREAAFRAWLNADPRHAAEYARLERVSQSLDQVMQWDYVSSLGKESPRDLERHPFWRSPVTFAAAALLAVTVSLWWKPWQGNSGESVQIAEVGGLKKKILPDGSTVELNTDSSIEVEFTPTKRGLRLVRGEAYFTVEKDPSRPFVVSAGQIAVRAVGTAFNVRIRKESVEVLVTDGVVDLDDGRVDPSPGPAQLEAAVSFLRAGQKAVITPPRANREILIPSIVIEPVPEEEISRHLAWQHRRIDFGPGSLSDLVEEFNRYNISQIVIADPAIADLSLGGSFRTDDTETLLTLLNSNFKIQSERRGNTIFLRRH